MQTMDKYGVPLLPNMFAEPDKSFDRILYNYAKMSARKYSAQSSRTNSSRAPSEAQPQA